MKGSPFVLCFFFLLWILQTIAEAQHNLDRIVITYPSRSIASVDLYIAQERGFQVGVIDAGATDREVEIPEPASGERAVRPANMSDSL